MAAVQRSILINRINRRTKHWFHKWVTEEMVPDMVKPSKPQTNFTHIYDEVDKVKKVLFESRKPVYEGDFLD